MRSKTYPGFRLREIAPVSILTGFCNARSALDRYAGQEISKHVLQEEKRENTENLEQEGRS